MAFVNRFGHAPPTAPCRDRRVRMHTIRMGEDAGFSRRSLRLLCGGWLPHDDGASEGCLALATDVGVPGGFVHIEANKSANLFHDSISCLPEPTPGRARTCCIKGREGHVIWPSPAQGRVSVTPAQLSMLLEGIDWRAPQRTWRPLTTG